MEKRKNEMEEIEISEVAAEQDEQNIKFRGMIML